MTLPKSQQKRPYHQHGEGFVKRALPFLMARVADVGIPGEALSPIEASARALRQEMTADLGSEPSAAQRALLEACTGSLIILQSLDAYLFRLASDDGLVNRRSRRAFVIVQDRMRVADSLARQLQALGLERRAKPPTDLGSYIAERYGGTPEPTADAANRSEGGADSREAPRISEQSGKSPSRPKRTPVP
jgi:hypothetical protein